VLQASAKWRLVWRLAPRLLEHWSETGRLNAINAAVTATTKKVCCARLHSSIGSNVRRAAHPDCLDVGHCMQSDHSTGASMFVHAAQSVTVIREGCVMRCCFLEVGFLIVANGSCFYHANLADWGALQ